MRTLVAQHDGGNMPHLFSGVNVVSKFDPVERREVIVEDEEIGHPLLGCFYCFQAVGDREDKAGCLILNGLEESRDALWVIDGNENRFQRRLMLVEEHSLLLCLSVHAISFHTIVAETIPFRVLASCSPSVQEWMTLLTDEDTTSKRSLALSSISRLPAHDAFRQDTEQTPTSTASQKLPRSLRATRRTFVGPVKSPVGSLVVVGNKRQDLSAQLLDGDAAQARK